MTKRIGAALFVATFILTGCKEVKIENGQIPDQYLQQTAQYMGTYSGSFGGVDSTLTLSLEGNVVHVSYKDAQGGTDILDPKCESSFGLLETITVSGSEEAPNLDAAVFAFNPNKCLDKVLGKAMFLEFKKKKDKPVKMGVGILQRYDWERVCSSGSPFPTNCTMRQVQVFIRGAYVKTN